MTQACQVDFYVLARPTQSPGQFVCRLAMMAWEQGHRILVRTEDRQEASRLDELMWDYPPGRFLPHGLDNDTSVPVAIATREDAIPEDRNLVINLCTEPVPGTERLTRLCEIVPAESSQRTASRDKFRTYRDRGLTPETHTIG
jgi:DNA polymerase-3 subunit chi